MFCMIETYCFVLAVEEATNIISMAFLIIFFFHVFFINFENIELHFSYQFWNSSFFHRSPRSFPPTFFCTGENNFNNFKPSHSIFFTICQNVWGKHCIECAYADIEGCERVTCSTRVVYQQWPCRLMLSVTGCSAYSLYPNQLSIQRRGADIKCIQINSYPSPSILHSVHSVQWHRYRHGFCVTHTRSVILIAAIERLWLIELRVTESSLHSLILTESRQVAVETAVVAVKIAFVQSTTMINCRTLIAWKYYRMHRNSPFSRPSGPSSWSRNRSHKVYSTSWRIVKNWNAIRPIRRRTSTRMQRVWSVKSPKSKWRSRCHRLSVLASRVYLNWLLRRVTSVHSYVRRVCGHCLTSSKGKYRRASSPSRTIWFSNCTICCWIWPLYMAA